MLLKYHFFFFIYFLLNQTASGQIDLSGTWKGLLRQHIMGSFTDSPYQLHIEQLNDSIYGTAYIEASEFLSIYAKMHFSGKILADSIYITEDEFLEGTDLNDAVGWCIKKLSLSHTLAKTGFQLKGNWSGYSSSNGKPCRPGIVLLEKETGKFQGIVKDSTSGALLNANVFIFNRSKREKIGKFETYQDEGDFRFFANESDTYQLLITSAGYHDKTYLLNINKIGFQDTLFMQPVKIGDLLEIGYVQFQQSSAIILSSSLSKLNKLAKFLNENKNIKIEISGHTSNEGDPEKNKALSLKRAKAVATYLIEKNIAKERLATKGFGEEVPIANNDLPQGRKKNRRVEFRVLLL
ncbi:MAG: OmpA family protein [Bacteroidota bacterium]